MAYVQGEISGMNSSPLRLIFAICFLTATLSLMLPAFMKSDIYGDEGSENEPESEAIEDESEGEIDIGELEVEASKESGKEALPGEDSIWVEFDNYSGALRGIGTELDLLGGLDASFFGSAFDITTVSIRGAAPHRSNVTLGGFSLSSETSGVFDFSMLPAGAIGGAEILRGPAAISKGMSGAIDMQLRHPAEPSVSFSIGSFGTFSVQAAMPLQISSSSQVYVSHEQSEGNFSFKRHDGMSYVRENNDRRKTALLFALSSEKEKDDTSFVFLAADKRGGAPGLAEFPSLDAYQSDSLFAAAITNEREISRDANLSATGFIRFSHTGFSDPNPYFGGSVETDQTEYALGTEFTYRMFDNGGITGVKLSMDGAKLSDKSYDNPSRGAAAFTVWREFYFDNTSLSGAATLDAATEGRAGWRAKFAAEHSLGNDWSLSASASKMFRRPNFSELYYPASGFIAGNPDLENESGYGIDFGVHFKDDVFSISAVSFLMRFIDSIQFVPVTQYRIRAENTGTIRNQGIAIDAALNLGNDWLVKTSFTYIEAEYMDGGLKQAGRPPRKFAVGISKEWTNSSANLTYLRTSAMPADRFGNIFVESSDELNASISIKIKRAMELTASCSNLLGGDLRNNLDFPRPGRSIEFTLKFSW